MKRKSKTPWADLFPNGRIIYYEGNNPRGFVKEIKAEFGFDPSKDRLWKGGPVSLVDNKGRVRLTMHAEKAFHCPARLLDKIYGTAKYPMGS